MLNLKSRLLIIVGCLTAGMLATSLVMAQEEATKEVGEKANGQTVAQESGETDANDASAAFIAALKANLSKTEMLDLGEMEFELPVRLTIDGEPVKTEAPGYASPAWADIDNDGSSELLVGQFAGGEIKVYRDLSKNGFAKAEWLQADGETAEVPGIW